MAAPAGHIFCALAFLSTGGEIADKNAFLVGTNFPDIRYTTDVPRSTTHKILRHDLNYVLETDSSFEAGRRFHVFVDEEREKYMRERGALRFVEEGPLKTQMLKLIEDHILFHKLKNKFDPAQVFSKIYDEERKFSLDDSSIETWHRLLSTYLDQSHWFNVTRYFKTFGELKKVYGFSENYFDNFWLSLKTLGFFIYAYFQVEKLSRNQELRNIIFDFYEIKMPDIIKSHFLKTRTTAKNCRCSSTIMLSPSINFF